MRTIPLAVALLISIPALAGNGTYTYLKDAKFRITETITTKNPVTGKTSSKTVSVTVTTLAVDPATGMHVSKTANAWKSWSEATDALANLKPGGKYRLIVPSPYVSVTKCADRALCLNTIDPDLIPGGL